jgi:hypothetical protein
LKSNTDAEWVIEVQFQISVMRCETMARDCY